MLKSEQPEDMSLTGRIGHAIGRLRNEAAAWMEGLLGLLPGAIGVRMRRLWIRSRLMVLGERSAWGSRMRISGGKHIRIGDDFAVEENSRISAEEGELSIGNQVSINRNVFIDASGGRIEIGNDVLIGPNVVLRASDHVFESVSIPINRQGHRGGVIVVGDDVWIAANVVVTSGVTIGAHSIVAAGAVVTRDVEPWSLVAGVPARVIRKRNV